MDTIKLETEIVGNQEI